MRASIIIATVAALLAPSQILAQHHDGLVEVCQVDGGCHAQEIRCGKCHELESPHAGRLQEARIRTLESRPKQCSYFRGPDCTGEHRDIHRSRDSTWLPFVPKSFRCQCQ